MELRFLLAAARRGWSLIILFAVVGLAVGGYLGESAAEVFVSRASLDIAVPQTTALLNSSYSEDPNRYIATQIAIIGSDAVARNAAKLVPGTTKKSIELDSSISQRGTSDVVDIVGKATSAVLAADIANALAQTYTKQQSQTLAAPLQAQIGDLSGQLTALQARISGLSTASATGAALAASLESQVAQVSQSLTQARLALRLSSSSVTIFDTASPSPTPEARHVPLKAGLGLAGGLVIGFLLSVLFVLARPRVVGPIDVEDILGVAVAADLPYVAVRERPSLVARHAGGLGFGEALSESVQEWDREVVRLSALVQAAPVHGRVRSVLVTSADGHAGTSMMAGDIAALFRTTGMTVELIDIEAGISVIGDGVSPERRKRVTQKVHSHSIPAPVGRGVPREEQAPSGHRWLQRIDGRAELVVFDGGALSKSADSVVLARSVDVVVVLIPVPNSTRGRLLRSLRAALVDSDAQVLFVTNHNRPASRRAAGFDASDADVLNEAGSKANAG